MSSPETATKSTKSDPTSTVVFALTISALIAFALNSTLCRLALKETAIGPIPFTFIRLTTGAIVLSAVVGLQQFGKSTQKINGTKFGTIRGAISLLGYAVCFSLAYISLPSGIGALLLFGAVQFTMISSGLMRGERLKWQQWLGFLAAIGGLLILLWPQSASANLTQQQLPYAGLMLIAGVCWGVYSLLAKGCLNATKMTAGNFSLATGIAVIGLLLVAMVPDLWNQQKWDPAGMVYAAISGTITSGIGYAIWYQALRYLQATKAATVQLSVPVLVAIIGVLTLGEPISWTLIGCAALILGGVAVVIRTA